MPTPGARILPEVQPSVEVPLAVSPDALGAGIGRSVQQAGDVAFQFHQQELHKFNETLVLDADNQQNALIQKGLNDPKTGLLKQPLGKDAPAAVDQFLADYDQQMAEIGKGLTNDDQRLAFQQMAQARKFHVERQLADYEEAETERFADETDAGSIQLQAQAAMNDPAAADDHVAQMRQIIARRADRKGAAPEVLEIEEKAAASQTYAGIITSAADAGDMPAARAYFNRWGDQLQGRDLKEVRGILKTGDERAESRAVADEIVAGLGDEADLQGALSALEERKIDNTDVYDQAKTRIVNTFRLAEEAETNRQGKLLDEATGFIDSSPVPSSPDAIPESVWNRMSAPYKRKAQLYAAAKARGEGIETPRELFAELEVQQATDPQAFAQRMQKEGLTLPLSRADFERYNKNAAAILKGDESLVASFQSNESAVNYAMRQGGMTPAEDPKDQKPDEVAFRVQLGKLVTAEQQSTNKKVSPERIAEIGKQLMQSITLQRTKRWNFPYDVSTAPDIDAEGNVTIRPFRIGGESYTEKQRFDHAFQSPVAMKLAYSPSQVPQDAQQDAIRALRNAGFAPKDITPAMIQDEYNQDLIRAYRDAE